MTAIVELPVLETITVCAAVMPTWCFPNERLVGETLIDAVLDDPPVPDKGIACGLLDALSNRLTRAVRVPEAVGVNFRLTVQLPPAATVAPTPGQVPRPAKAKSPLFVPVIVNPLVMVRAELPLLLRVT